MLAGLAVVIAVIISAVLADQIIRSQNIKQKDKMRKTLQANLKPLDFKEPPAYPPPVSEYFEFYNLAVNDPNTEHFFGTFDSNGYTLAAHVYIPANPQATVVLHHGYLNHSAQHANLIHVLLRHNYAVAAYDMPGHGLSTGKGAWIDSFNTYTAILADFTEIVKQNLPGPYHLIGISCGGAVTLDTLLTRPDDFERFILCAPLVRSVSWNASRFGYTIASPFVKSVPRHQRKISNDPEWLHFNKYLDYLHASSVPFRWVKAMFNWDKKFSAAEPVYKSALLVQGDKDNIVDYKHNLSVIKQKIPNLQIEMIESGRHELFNESKSIRREVFAQILRWLGSTEKTELSPAE